MRNKLQIAVFGSDGDHCTKKSSKDIQQLTELQQALLQNGFNHLKTAGVLVYVTCALNRYENEDVIARFLDSNPSAKVEIPELDRFDIDYNASNLGIRITPGKTRGLYFTKIRKTIGE
ncbi:hypothetical protein J4232_04110 [Candidatus Woesearchaeota archaeon]|nr:hypothetical protein [Candidatus Woesearchaeota archaeon]